MEFPTKVPTYEYKKASRSIGSFGLVAKVAAYDLTVVQRCLTVITRQGLDPREYYVQEWESDIPGMEVYPDLYMQLQGPEDRRQRLPGLLARDVIQLSGVWLLDEIPSKEDLEGPFFPTFNPDSPAD